MSIELMDTFDGPAGELIPHVGQTGAAWSDHGVLANVPYNNAHLSGTGELIMMPLSYTYRRIVMASGVPAGAEYDIRVPFHFYDLGGDGLIGVAFKVNPASENYYRLDWGSYWKRWNLIKVTNGTDADLGSYTPSPPAAGAVMNVEIRVRNTSPKIAVYVDSISRITTDDSVDTGGVRMGFVCQGSGGSGAEAGQGLQFQSIMSGSPGFVLPTYGVTGPSTGAPGSPSADFTVSLFPGVNPGSITITPSASGVPGVFTPASVTLTDADRTKTFTFTPSGAGPSTISFANNTGSPNQSPMDYAAGLSLPTRVANWQGFWGKFHTSGSAPYLAGDTNPDGSGGYYLDVTDHYDPILVYYMVQDWCVRNGLPLTNWGDQIAAAVTRFRDRAVRADPGLAAGEGFGVQEYHRYATGIVRHHYESTTLGDLAKNYEALGYLDKRNFPDYLVNYGHPGTYREAAFILNTLIDWELMGLGVHPNINDAIETCLHQNVYTAVQGPTRRWGISIKPFMVGINNWALSRAWERYRNSADPARAALCAQIPNNIKGICQYMWDVCWYPSGVDVPYEGGSWGHGAIAYKDLALSDPMFTRLLNQDITSVSNRFTFRGPTTLSTVDDYYNENVLELIHPTTGNVGDRWIIGDYAGATREVTIATNYRPNFDFDASWSFNFIPAMWQPLESDGDRGPEPAMNLMALFGFAFTYWHQKRVALDDAAAGVWRNRAHEMFNGAKQSWDYPFNSKLMHQGTYLAIPALDYLSRGDQEWPLATAFRLRAPAIGAAGDSGSSSGPFRISIPYGQRVAAPEVVTPSAPAGAFSGPAPILSNDLRMAMFTYTPDASQDGTVVAIGAAGPTLGADATVAFSVGGEGIAAVTSYTLTGPAGGEVNALSSAFTLTLGEGTVAGTIRFTPTASAGSGIFIPAYVDLTESTRTGTFVFIPTSVGARNVSAPDNGGLPDPAPVSYLALPSTVPAAPVNDAPRKSDGGVRAPGTAAYKLIIPG